jgi:hypothetical protein
MALPLDSDNPPMEARPVQDLPEGEQWRYEPKWDGFRCLAFRDGENVELRSKSGQPLGRYFPDVAAAVAGLSARQFVLDGEIIIPVERKSSAACRSRHCNCACIPRPAGRQAGRRAPRHLHRLRPAGRAGRQPFDRSALRRAPARARSLSRDGAWQSDDPSVAERRRPGGRARLARYRANVIKLTYARSMSSALGYAFSARIFSKKGEV